MPDAQAGYYGIGDHMQLIVGISGATGVIYGIRLLEVLRSTNEIETHLIITTAACVRRVFISRSHASLFLRSWLFRKVCIAGAAYVPSYQHTET